MQRTRYNRINRYRVRIDGNDWLRIGPDLGDPILNCGLEMELLGMTCDIKSNAGHFGTTFHGYHEGDEQVVRHARSIPC